TTAATRFTPQAVEDRATRELLHHSRCIGGLYPITSGALSCHRRSQVHSVIKPSLARWHQRLGQPSLVIVKQIVNKDNLLLSHSQVEESICDACQCAKSHQLPYP
uniref:GAG-pre-integrase domain-containing protein n=1 Tax=Triticum urartu TaxID=4572 RepID=A0A8R7Q6R3_TRIUA